MLCLNLHIFSQSLSSSSFARFAAFPTQQSIAGEFDELAGGVVQGQDGHAEEHADHPADVAGQAPAVVGKELSLHTPRVLCT